MTFDLSSVAPVKDFPPRVVLYGVPGIGKTTLAAQADNAVLLPIERGATGRLDSIQTFPQPESYDDVLEAINSLIEEDHSFGTLIVDGIDTLEMLIWKWVCENIPHEKGHAVERIEDYGFGKGYSHATEQWADLVGGLNMLVEQKHMAVILIAHANIVEFQSPDTDAYERYQLRLHSNKKQNPEGIVTGWCDALLFMNYEVALISDAKKDRKRAVGKGQRVIHTCERPAFKAKNRYGMPDAIKIPENDPKAAWDEIATYLFGEEKAEPKTTTRKKATRKKAAATKE